MTDQPKPPTDEHGMYHARSIGEMNELGAAYRALRAEVAKLKKDLWRATEYGKDAVDTLKTELAAITAQCADHQRGENSALNALEVLRDENARLKAEIERHHRDFERWENDAVAERQRAERAEAECLEQARLNGMGSEREAKLLAELAKLRKDAERFVTFAWPDPICDAIGDVDLHERAGLYASVLGREDPNRDDYVAALRDACDQAPFDAAIARSKGGGDE